MSQRDFARRLGISTSTLQRIELRSLKLPEAIAFRISAITGADKATLSTALRSAFGGPYSKVIFDGIQRLIRSPAAEHESAYMAREFGHRVKLLLCAAQKRHQLPLVISDLWKLLGDIRDRHGLRVLSDELLRKNAGFEREDWYDIAPPGADVFFDDDGYTIGPAIRITSGQLARLLGKIESGEFVPLGSKEKVPGRALMPRSKRSSRKRRR